jgi:hypothetical protein
MALDYVIACRTCQRVCVLGKAWPLLGVAADVPLTDREALLLAGVPHVLAPAARLVWFLERHPAHVLILVTVEQAYDAGVFADDWREEG